MNYDIAISDKNVIKNKNFNGLNFNIKCVRLNLDQTLINLAITQN